jgi:alpha-galactosidase
LTYLMPWREHGSTGNFVISHFSPPGVPTGWCSWYQYSSSQFIGTISDREARCNLEAMARLSSCLPLEVFQIDDGYQAQVGDWLAFSPSFPEGVAPLATQARQAGFTPGLWLAPFIVHPRSRAEHPAGCCVGVGTGRSMPAFWGGFLGPRPHYPEALGYAAKSPHRCSGGFLIEADFHAAALPGGATIPPAPAPKPYEPGWRRCAPAGEDAYPAAAALGPGSALVTPCGSAPIPPAAGSQLRTPNFIRKNPVFLGPQRRPQRSDPPRTAAGG